MQDAFDAIELSPEEIATLYRKNPKKDAFDDIEFQESWGKSVLRKLLQVPRGIAQAATYPADLINLIAAGESIDPEEIDHLRAISEREGIPFDEEAYREAAAQAASTFPTISNISRITEEKTGIPLEARTGIEKAIQLGATAGTAIPGALTQKAAAAITAPTVSAGLHAAGVPEPVAEAIGLGASGFAAAKTPKGTLEKATKQSGMIERRFEKLEKPTDVPAKKIAQINEKLEEEFRGIADKIIEKAPVGETRAAIKDSATFKQEANQAFEQVEALADQLPTQLHTENVKKNLVDRVIKKKGTGFSPSEYDKSHKKHITEILKETPAQNVTAKDLVTQYRKNNKALGELYEPGQSFAYNSGKREALIDYNKAIADIIEKEFPDSEFSKLFKSTNEQWTKIKDAEAIDKFMDKLFDGKIQYGKGREFFDKQGMTKPFKRALGEEGFKDYEQLMKDLMTTEQAMKFMKPAKEQGFFDLAKTGLHFLVDPRLAKIKAGWEIMRGAMKTAHTALLDKPQLAFIWDRGIKAVKKGDFKGAEKDFALLQKELDSATKESAKQAKAQSKENVPTANEKPKTAEPLRSSSPQETVLLEQKAPQQKPVASSKESKPKQKREPRQSRELTRSEERLQGLKRNRTKLRDLFSKEENEATANEMEEHLIKLDRDIYEAEKNLNHNKRVDFFVEQVHKKIEKIHDKLMAWDEKIANEHRSGKKINPKKRWKDTDTINKLRKQHESLQEEVARLERTKIL